MPEARPDELVCALALAKGREVAAMAESEDIVIAADTIVWYNGRVFGKPHSREEAVAMLSALSGNTHQVYTGVALISGGREICEAEMTKVRFRSILPEEIESYVAGGEPMDKAGAYGAQGVASVFVEGIEGDFFNVMGLPVCRLDAMLKKLGKSKGTHQLIGLCPGHVCLLSLCRDYLHILHAQHLQYLFPSGGCRGKYYSHGISLLLYSNGRV